MKIGDMRYTFVNDEGQEVTVEIPAQAIRGARAKGLSNKQACQLYMYEQGYISEKPEGVDLETMTNTQKKTRTRKPNETKREIINQLADRMTEAYGSVEITNAERQFHFVIDGNTYEVTLVQKRK